MNNIRLVASGAIVFAAALFCTAAQAQLFRAYLSSAGSDANSCTLVAPCRLLPAALAAVADGGEIWMLDSANYNTATVSVTKSVTILAIPGEVGSVLSIGGPAIDISTASVDVVLRNLVIGPLPSSGATHGVRFSLGNSLTIDRCLISNLPLIGVFAFAPNSRVRVIDSVLSGNNSGVAFEMTGGSGDVANSRLTGNQIGVYVYSGGGGTVSVAVTDSLASQNSSVGIQAMAANSGSSVRMQVTNTTIANNSTGLSCQALLAGTTAFCTAGHNMIVGNTAGGLSIGPGPGTVTFKSSGDNIVVDNSPDVTGTISLVSPLR
jgi:hypothetical protein